MHPRRMVERFDEVIWTSKRGQDGRTYLAVFKVNGESESFKVAVPLSDTVRLIASDELGRKAREEDWEAAVRMKIIDLVPHGLLDSWPPSETKLISGIDYREVDTLFSKAKGKGLVKA